MDHVITCKYISIYIYLIVYTHMCTYHIHIRIHIYEDKCMYRNIDAVLFVLSEESRAHEAT